MNPRLDNVPEAFAQVSTRARSLAIDRKGVVLPEGGHFQGIQRLESEPLRLVITSSSNTQAYLVVCGISADGKRGRANPPLRLASSPLDHAGGCQTAGDFLAVGVEDFGSRRRSEVQFWNLAGSPKQVRRLTVQRNGAEKVSTAGAVGLSSYRAGAVLAVATWDAETVDFYATARDPFRVSGAKFQFRATWAKAKANKEGWIDGNFGKYQSVNLLTESDDKLYLVGFNRSGGDDWMDLFSVDLDAPPARMLKKIGKKHMFCSNGCNFSHGAGVYVPSAARFEAYAVNGDSGDHVSGTTIHANHFRPG